MTPGTAYSLVLLVLGVSACWMFVLWLVVGHYAKTTKAALGQLGEMHRNTWAHAVSREGQPATVSQLAHSAADAARGVDEQRSSFAALAPMPTDDQLLGLQMH